MGNRARCVPSLGPLSPGQDGHSLPSNPPALLWLFDCFSCLSPGYKELAEFYIIVEPGLDTTFLFLLCVQLEEPSRAILGSSCVSTGL